MNSDNKQQSVVTIDEHALDKECIRLPSDYLKYAHRAAECKRDVDEAKAQLDLVQARVSADIRADPAKYGLEKVTESAISTTVLMHKRYQEAAKTHQDAKLLSEQMQAVVWALEHKKRSLTLLVELHGMGYFANPKITEKGREAVEKMTQRRVRTHRDD